jgi:NAD(P)-dependent dehydrogenase (short-subunit alcohol dehydrogenase family)
MGILEIVQGATCKLPRAVASIIRTPIGLEAMHVKQLFDLSGKVAMVTGGSRGLGLEIATGLGEAGAAVVVTARRAQWLASAEQELTALGITHLATTCDVSQPDQVSAALSAALQRFEQIDVLVNNAGISWGEPVDTMPLDKWRAVLETNVTGCFLMSQAVGKEMIRSKRGGSIINIASVTALVGTDPEILDAIGYTASKGAIVSMTRDLAVKWAQFGIRVNAIAPGFFDTRLSAGVLQRSRADIERSIPMDRIGQPGELKGVALFLASAAAAYITGQVLAVDGGATAW